MSDISFKLAVMLRAVYFIVLWSKKKKQKKTPQLHVIIKNKILFVKCGSHNLHLWQLSPSWKILRCCNLKHAIHMCYKTRFNLDILLMNFLSLLVVCSNELMEAGEVNSNSILSAVRNFDVFEKTHLWTIIKTRFSWNFSKKIF